MAVSFVMRAWSFSGPRGFVGQPRKLWRGNRVPEFQLSAVKCEPCHSRRRA